MTVLSFPINHSSYRLKDGFYEWAAGRPLSMSESVTEDVCAPSQWVAAVRDCYKIMCVYVTLYNLSPFSVYIRNSICSNKHTYRFICLIDRI